MSALIDPLKIGFHRGHGVVSGDECQAPDGGECSCGLLDDRRALAAELAALRALVESAYKEGWSEGYSEGLSDGQSWSGARFGRSDSEQDWKFSDSRKALQQEVDP